MLTSIISGGATGAERGALRAAIDLDIGYGGWRWCEDEVPEVYTSRMRPALSRAMQRRLNVQDSDATLFVMRPGSKECGCLTIVPMAYVQSVAHGHRLPRAALTRNLR